MELLCREGAFKQTQFLMKDDLIDDTIPVEENGAWKEFPTQIKGKT